MTNPKGIYGKGGKQPPNPPLPPRSQAAIPSPPALRSGEGGRFVPWQRDLSVMICKDCGALVTDTDAHDGWHRRVEPQPEPRRF